MFSGVTFKEDGEGGRFLGLDDVPTNHLTRIDDRDVMIIAVAIDRIGVGYERNWAGFHKRKWARDQEKYSNFVWVALDSEFGSGEADSVLQLDSTDDKLKLIRTLGRTLWDSQFENYSRFTGKKLVYKSGDETIDNIIHGGGAVCSEKVQALKFLTDHYGLSSEYIIAGENAVGPVPVEELRELLTTFDFRFSKRYMRFWQHTALLYDVDGVRILVDATNGNIPFLFLVGDEAKLLCAYPAKEPLTVRMSLHKETFYYHRVSQDIPENFLFALEGWIPEADLIQVFENELGLFISEEFFVTAIPYQNQREFLDLKSQYQGACEKVGLRCFVGEEWTLDSEIGRQFTQRHPFPSQQILASKQHLLSRYNDSEGSGHQAGLVVIGLERHHRACAEQI